MSRKQIEIFFVPYRAGNAKRFRSFVPAFGKTYCALLRNKDDLLVEIHNKEWVKTANFYTVFVRFVLFRTDKRHVHCEQHIV